MTTHKRADPVFDALVRSVEELTDEEIEAEFAEDGEDLVAVAASTRATLLGAIAEHQQELRAALGRERAEQLESLSQSGARLPKSPAARRALLGDVLKRHPDERATVTAQFRKLNEMSDADVESALRQLAFLGLIEDPEDGG